MTDQNKDTGHDYDGIKELDNDLPKWWLNLFWITIFFSVAYIYYYHVDLNGGKSPTEAFNEAEEQRIFSQIKKPEVKFDEKALAALFTDKKVRGLGAQVFTQRCVSCHGTKGEGGVGPNLTDDYWLHGNKFVDVANSVYKGIPEKGMIAWSALLSQSEIEQVVVYIKTLRGTNPANAKAPQGDLVKVQ